MSKYKKVLVMLMIITFSFLLISCGTHEVSYGSDLNQNMDIYIPKGLSENEVRPVILYIHGGGWTSGDKTNFSYMQKPTNEIGYIYVSMNYQFASNDNNYLILLNDVKLVVDYLYDNAQTYHIDTTQMAVFGSSAGAHLALLYAYKITESKIPVELVVSSVGPTDFINIDPLDENISDSSFGMLSNLMNKTYDRTTYSMHTNDEDLIDASPISHVTTNSAPTIMAYGKLDQLVPYSNAIALDKKLTLCDVDHVLITYEHSGHDLSNELDQENNDVLLDDIVTYLNTYLSFA